MKRSLNLIVPEEVAQQLEHLAEREFRRPRDEAALLLVQAVRRAALDPDQRPWDPVEPPVSRLGRSRPASDTAARTDALDGAR